MSCKHSKKPHTPASCGAKSLAALLSLAAAVGLLLAATPRSAPAEAQAMDPVPTPPPVVSESPDAPKSEQVPASQTVPILMYHSFSPDDSGCVSDTIVSAHTFEAQLRTLSRAGYETVTYQDLIDYVYEGAPLPEKPVLITADDGYQDNLTIMAPLLEAQHFTATVAVIGCSVGKDTYKDTGVPISPHFSLEDAAEWVDKGVLDIQPHSYDMHQVPALDGAGCRSGVLMLPGENEEDYQTALTEDFLRAKEQLEGSLDVTCQAFTYPYGAWDSRSEEILHCLGVRVTVTTKSGSNRLVRGQPKSLSRLRRYAVTNDMTGEALLSLLEG